MILIDFFSLSLSLYLNSMMCHSTHKGFKTGKKIDYKVYDFLWTTDNKNDNNPLLLFIIQFRRAKVRKREHTKKGPGRPAHNAHPQTCSGEPIPPEEIKAREKWVLKINFEKQRKKLIN